MSTSEIVKITNHNENKSIQETVSNTCTHRNSKSLIIDAYDAKQVDKISTTTSAGCLDHQQICFVFKTPYISYLFRKFRQHPTKYFVTSSVNGGILGGITCMANKLTGPVGRRFSIEY